MTTAAMTSIPITIGSALVSAIGRGLLWAIVTTIKAPVTTGLLVCMTLGTAYAATNALYLQTSRHPAPLFADHEMTTASVSSTARPEPVRGEPAVQRATAATPAATAEPVRQPVAMDTPPVPAIPEAIAQIDHADVKALQEKLAALGYYEGTPDGFYGPRTASAIRAFEQRTGMQPRGALTPEILKAVAAAKPEPAAAAVQDNSAALAQPVAPVRQTELAAVKTTGNAGLKETPRTTSDPLVQIARSAAGTVEKAVAAGPATDPDYVEKIQRGLASLGFLRGRIDGVAGEDTARAIRNFEVYYNYKVTGEATPELIDLLQQAGAQI